VARELPTGTVTFLFTDVEGSTKLLNEFGAERYGEELAEHRRLLREAIERHGGVEVDTQGDAFFVAFPTAPEAIAAATEAQQALSAGPIRVRMGVHTGTPLVGDEGYVGPDVHRAARIASAGHGGQVLVSTSTASLVREELLRDLGEHRLKDLGAPERIYQLNGGDFPALKSLRQTNLPIPATPFLGRERELAEIAGLLARDDVRLLTLTGPAGTGKTRLALQAAAQASDRYPDGVFWAPLAALQDTKLLLEAAAQALEARNGLAERIGDRRILLLFDNFEHLIDAADDLARLLAACPNLRLVVTSRELLRLPGEQAYPVSPLEPQDATELFIARAQSVDPGFAPGPAVEELCSRLDNLPLALELAAARVPVLSPEQLLDRLAERLDLLKAGRGVDPRQQTLRATIEWSYELLDEEERLLFERLSVFRGGCTLEAAEAVCDADVDALQSLIEKSLLRRQGERFWMLETIREYAVERLERRGEPEEVRRRHAEHFLRRVEETREAVDADPPDAPQPLEHDFANLRAASASFAEAGNAERDARLAIAAYMSLWTWGHNGEMHGWLIRALDRADALSSQLRADLLGTLALSAAHVGESQASRRFAEESLALARELGDKPRIEWALRATGWTEEDPVEARRIFSECEAILRELGNEQGLAWVLTSLGDAEMKANELEKAKAAYEEAAEIFARLGRRYEAANARRGSGEALVAQGRAEEAAAILRTVLREALEIRSLPLVAETMGLLAVTRLDRDPAAGVRVLAAAARLFHDLGLAYMLQQQPLVDEAERRAHQILGDRFQTAWEAGGELTVDEAAALALEGRG